jgi:predicted aspartyl protease
LNLRIQDGLPFVSATVERNGKSAKLNHVLVDTGSAGSVFAADLLERIGLVYEPQDRVERIQGVGGAEFVFSKTVNSLVVGDITIDSFAVEVGSLDYGFDIDAILGMDWLLRVGAVVDLSLLQLHATH